jgi:hypothetical protein
MMVSALLLVLLPALAAAAEDPCPPRPCAALADHPSASCRCAAKHEVESVYALLERILPGERDAFALSFAAQPALGYTITASGGKVAIAAAGANELAAGLGYYLRQHCNNVIGWPRGGASARAQPPCHHLASPRSAVALIRTPVMDDGCRPAAVTAPAPCRRLAPLQAGGRLAGARRAGDAEARGDVVLRDERLHALLQPRPRATRAAAPILDQGTGGRHIAMPYTARRGARCDGSAALG